MSDYKIVQIITTNCQANALVVGTDQDEAAQLMAQFQSDDPPAILTVTGFDGESASILTENVAGVVVRDYEQVEAQA